MLFLCGFTVFAAAIVGLLVKYREIKPKTAAERIEFRKRLIIKTLTAEWKTSVDVGSEERIADWLKRKLPLLDDEWIASQDQNMPDHRFITAALTYFFSTPGCIEWFIKTDNEREVEEVAE